MKQAAHAFSAPVESISDDRKSNAREVRATTAIPGKIAWESASPMKANPRKTT